MTHVALLEDYLAFLENPLVEEFVQLQDLLEAQFTQDIEVSEHFDPLPVRGCAEQIHRLPDLAWHSSHQYLKRH